LDAVDEHPAGGWSVETAEDVQERRLAAPRATADRQKLARPRRQVDPAEGSDRDVAGWVLANEIGGLEDGVPRPAATARAAARATARAGSVGERHGSVSSGAPGTSAGSRRGGRTGGTAGSRSGQMPTWSSSRRSRTPSLRPSA